MSRRIVTTYRTSDPMWETYRTDPMWESEYSSRFSDMERGMREMDRQFGDVYHQFRRLTPPGSSRRFDTLDEAFPDSTMQVTDREGRRFVNCKFDVRNFRPEEISIKSFDDNRVEVTAKHETQDGNHQVYREYRRTCVMPEGVNMEEVKSNLQPSGMLSIEAPLPSALASTSTVQPRNAPIAMQIEHQGKSK